MKAASEPSHCLPIIRMKARLFRRRECWVPTARGWIAAVLLFLACGAALVRLIASFLSVNQPVTADVLIVEGWLPDYAMRGAVEEFKHGRYKYVVTSGEADPDLASWAHPYRTWAEFAAANLEKLGIQTNYIVSAPSAFTTHDRTYTSALGVENWLEANHSSTRSVNVYTLGAHARRTRLLFEKALGSKMKVGIFAHPDNSYNTRRWWATSEGVRDVVSEGVAYVYARCLFPLVPQKSKA
jgi:hypothetical protein